MQKQLLQTECLLMKMNIVGKVIEHNFKCNNVYKPATNFFTQNMESMLKFTFKGFHSHACKYGLTTPSHINLF